MHDRAGGTLSREGIKLAERTAVKNGAIDKYERLKDIYLHL